MNGHDKTWESTRDNYLRQVKEALAAAKYPGSKSIIEEVRQHLEQRYAELPAEKRNWESYQAIITEMGPSSDYVDLLGIGKLKRRIVTWRRIAVAVPLILIVLVWAWDRGLIPLGIYNGPRTYVIPEAIGASWPQPFRADERLVGKWEVVDFVNTPSQFMPGKKYREVNQSGWAKTVEFLPGGIVSVAQVGYSKTWDNGCRWTKDWILEQNSRIQAQYEIKDIGGNKYLFYPWISGDVTIRYMQPSYYVMKKVSDMPAPVTHGDKAVKFDKSSGIIPGFDINTATLDDVIKTFGQPQKYMWGNEELARDKLPQQYIAVYPSDFSVCMSNGQVMELRHEGEDGYVFAGKVKIGSTLQEVLAALGEPKETVVGKANKWADGVLYKDIDGQEGRCYYARSDRGVRLFFRDYKTIAVYLTRDDNGKTTPTVTRIKSVVRFEDVRLKDLSDIDLSKQTGIVATLSFDKKTIWPKSLPSREDPAEILKSAMDPGLGVRALHSQGITGKGVNVAIIDQPLYQDHPEFAGKIVKYYDTGCKSDSSMHGPAVASLLVGTNCGTAPEAMLYYVAAPSWLGDSAYYARGLDWIVEQSAALPSGQKIRAVSVSAAPSGPGSPFTKNNELWDQACERARKAGILVLDCTRNKGFVSPGWYDPGAPDDVTQCSIGFPGRSWPSSTDHIVAPCSVRTTAQEEDKGDFGYAYWGMAGVSWSIPYCTGVLAMGWQVTPELTAEEMKELLFKSAYVNPNGVKFIDPGKFIEMVRKKL